MDGVHDLGGVQGYGPVPFQAGEVARADARWEAVAGAAMFALLRSGLTNLDAHRHRVERLDPDRYFSVGYWGRWLAAVETAVVEQGVMSADAVDRWVTDAGHQPDHSAAPPRLHPIASLESKANAPGFIRPVDRDPRFVVGEVVQTVPHAPNDGHHRLPRYARGRRGTVARVYPAFTFPDAMAHGQGEQPCHVYAVAFTATELWGPDADPAQRCHLDVFEPYLLGPTEPATAAISAVATTVDSATEH